MAQICFTAFVPNFFLIGIIGIIYKSHWYNSQNKNKKGETVIYHFAFLSMRLLLMLNCELARCDNRTVFISNCVKV